MLKRNEAHNRILTAVRIRPPNSNELKSSVPHIVTKDGGVDGGILIVDPGYFSSNESSDKTKRQSFERHFSYDYSFCPNNPGSEQEDIYSTCGKPLLNHVRSGYNCCLIAYGQTGSGKTYTMLGDRSCGESTLGIIPRLCKDLIDLSNADRMSEGFSKSDLSVSFYEIYNEKVFDLMSVNTGVPCRVREHREEGAYVESLTKIQLLTLEDFENVLSYGLRMRSTAATLMNASSSRSHAVFTIYLFQEFLEHHNNAPLIIRRESRINLVDLAGSERASLTGVSGERLTEANNINKSLSTLGDVIKALSTHSSKGKYSQSNSIVFVPYRNSMLTWLLKESLSGNSKTSMLATVSPSASSFFESMSTLRYIERVKLVSTSAIVNDKISASDAVLKLQRQVKNLTEKVKLLENAVEIKTQENRQLLEDLEKLRNDSARPLRVLSGSESSLSIDRLDDNDYLKALLLEKEEIIRKYEEVFTQSSSPNKQHFKSVFASYKKERSTLEDHLGVLMEQIRSLNDDMEISRKDLESKVYENKELIQEMQVMNQKMLNINSQNMILAQEIEETQNDMQSKNDEINFLNQVIRDLQQRLNSFCQIQTITNTSPQCSPSRKINDSMSSEDLRISHICKERDRLRVALAENIERCHELQAQLDKTLIVSEKKVSKVETLPDRVEGAGNSSICGGCQDDFSLIVRTLRAEECTSASFDDVIDSLRKPSTVIDANQKKRIESKHFHQDAFELAFKIKSVFERIGELTSQVEYLSTENKEMRECFEEEIRDMIRDYELKSLEVSKKHAEEIEEIASKRALQYQKLQTSLQKGCSRLLMVYRQMSSFDTTRTCNTSSVSFPSVFGTVLKSIIEELSLSSDICSGINIGQISENEYDEILSFSSLQSSDFESKQEWNAEGVCIEMTSGILLDPAVEQNGIKSESKSENEKTRDEMEVISNDNSNDNDHDNDHDNDALMGNYATLYPNSSYRSEFSNNSDENMDKKSQKNSDKYSCINEPRGLASEIVIEMKSSVSDIFQICNPSLESDDLLGDEAVSLVDDLSPTSPPSPPPSPPPPPPPPPSTQCTVFDGISMDEDQGATSNSDLDVVADHAGIVVVGSHDPSFNVATISIANNTAPDSPSDTIYDVATTGIRDFVEAYGDITSNNVPDDTDLADDTDDTDDTNLADIADVADDTDVTYVTDVTDVADVANVADDADVCDVANGTDDTDVADVADFADDTDDTDVADVANVADDADVGDVADDTDDTDDTNVADIADVADDADVGDVGDVADDTNVADVADDADVGDDADVADIADDTDDTDVADVADVADDADVADIADDTDDTDVGDDADVADIADDTDDTDVADVADVADDTDDTDDTDVADVADDDLVGDSSGSNVLDNVDDFTGRDINDSASYVTGIVAHDVSTVNDVAICIASVAAGYVVDEVINNSTIPDADSAVDFAVDCSAVRIVDGAGSSLSTILSHSVIDEDTAIAMGLVALRDLENLNRAVIGIEEEVKCAKADDLVSIDPAVPLVCGSREANDSIVVDVDNSNVYHMTSNINGISGDLSSLSLNIKDEIEKELNDSVEDLDPDHERSFESRNLNNHFSDDGHDFKDELVQAKLELALQTEALESYRMETRRMESVVCDLKLKMASLFEELDDKSAVIELLRSRLA